MIKTLMDLFMTTIISTWFLIIASKMANKHQQSVNALLIAIIIIDVILATIIGSL